MTRPPTHGYDREPVRYGPAAPRGSGDPLTDSGVHRFNLGTQVRLHLHGGEHVDCGLLDVQDVATWPDLVLLITKVLPVVVTGPRRHAFAGGVVLRVECISDPDPAAKPRDAL